METQLKAKKSTQHYDIWVPKRTIQAQQGLTQIWVPKMVLSKSYDTRLWTQVPKKQQRQQKATSKASQKMDLQKKARNEGQQKTNKIRPLSPTYQQIWVKKTLLTAQGESTYKWVPKQLLNQATIPAKQTTT